MSQAEVHIKTCGKQEGEEDQDEDEEEMRDDEDEKVEDEEEEEVYQCGECDLILSDYESMQVGTGVWNSHQIFFKSWTL